MPHGSTNEDNVPDDPRKLAELAGEYHRQGKLLPALKLYDRVIDLGKADLAIWLAVGNALTDIGEYAQAIGAFENAIEMESENPETEYNLARTLYRLGRVDEAAARLRVAAKRTDLIDPWLSLATLIPGCSQADSKEILDVRVKLAAELRKRLAPVAPDNAAGSGAGDDGVLRVGYLSGHFADANYMKPVWALINRHDRAAFEIHLFSDSVAQVDWSGYVKHENDRVHEAGSLGNDELGRLIESRGIDILVDLSAYSRPDRLPLFLRRLAPVTMAWFNMYATSGMPGIDYIVGDEQVVRPHEESLHTEDVLRLPLSYLTFEVTHPTPPVVDPPWLRNGYPTFGSLVSQYKLTPAVLDAWAEILLRAPRARLILANSALKSACNRQFMLDEFSRRGVPSDRVTLLGPADHMAFLRYYDRVDIALDAFPYNGGTTTMEAIWQGVPVLTFDGDRWASRTSQSLLRNCHLSEWVAADVSAMIDFAVKMAGDSAAPTKLADLRRRMRERLRASAVCDARTLARSMEALYRAAWMRRAERC